MSKNVIVWIILLAVAATPLLGQYSEHQIQSGTFHFYTWSRPVVSPDGRWAFVANADRNEIVRLDLQTLTADAIPAGTHPAALTLSRDGSLLAAVNYGTIQFAGDTVSLYKVTATGVTALTSFNANGNFDYYNNVVITPDNMYAFVASRYNGYLYAFDPWSGQLVHAEFLGTMPTDSALSPDGKWLAVLCRQNNFLNVKVLNLADFYQNQSFHVQYNIVTSSLGQDPTNLGFSPDGQELYVPGYSQNRLLVYSMEDGSAQPYYVTGTGPVGVSVDAEHGKLFVVNVAGNSLTLVDIDSGDVTQKTYAGFTFDGDNFVVPVPGSHSAFVASRLGNRLLAFDPRNGDSIDSYTPPEGPCRIAIDREGAVLVTVCQQSNRLYVLTTNRRLGIYRAESDDQSNLGFSFVNPLPTQNYPLTLTPISDGGSFGTPRNVNLAGGAQYVREWNSPDLGLPVPFSGWALGSTTLYDTRGFTMFYASNLDWMDGFAFGAPPQLNLVIPYLDLTPGHVCRIHLVNPNSLGASIQMQLYRNNALVSSRIVNVSANNRRVYDGSEFQVTDPAFLVLQSNYPIWALVEFGDEVTRACLPAETFYATGRMIVLPHVAEGSSWRTRVVLVNTDNINAAQLQARYYSETGVTLATKTINILSGRMLLDDVWSIFGLSEPTDLRTGWIEMSGDAARVHAAVIFSGENDQVLSALPAQTTPQSDIYFSHIAQDDLYYTGIALVNDSGQSTSATVEIRDAAGVLVNSVPLTGLGDRNKFIRLLSDPLFGVNQQVGGYIHIKSDRPLFAYSLFGITGQLLSAIPFQ